MRDWRRISISDIDIIFCDNIDIIKISGYFVETDAFDKLEFLGNKLYKIRYETFDHPLCVIPFITFASDIDNLEIDTGVLVKFLGLVSNGTDGYFLSNVAIGSAVIGNK